MHAGFLRSWRRNGLDDRVLEHIRSIVAEEQMDVGLVQFLITGEAPVLVSHLMPGLAVQ